MQTRIQPERKRASYAFDSLPELGRYLIDAPVTWGGANSSRTRKPHPCWDLNAGYDKAVKYSVDGWLEGASKLTDALKTLPFNTPKAEYKNDFYGHMPNVPRFCAGAPDSMIHRVRDPNDGQGRILTLVIPVNAMGGVDGKSMSNFGLAVAQYINQVEAEGKRVEVIGAICSYVSGWTVTHTFVVKESGQFFDPAVIAFAIGHPAMFRRLGFALRERCAAPRDYGYGNSTNLKLEYMINPPPGAIILNGMKEADVHARTPEAALKYITKQIDKAFDNAEVMA